MSIRWEYAADLRLGRSHPILEPDFPWVDGGEDAPPHPSEVKAKRVRARPRTLVPATATKELVEVVIPREMRKPHIVTGPNKPASMLDDLAAFEQPPERPKVIDVPKPPPKKPRRIVTPGAKFGKPVGVYGKISDDVLRDMHARHLAGESIRQIGREVWDLFGYASPAACANSISAAWKRMGLYRQDRAEATAAANRVRHAGKRTCRFVSARGRICDVVPLTDSPYCAKHKPEEIAKGIAMLRAKDGAR